MTAELFFVINHPDSGLELWVSDGTEPGTGSARSTSIQEPTPPVRTIYPNSSEPRGADVDFFFPTFNAEDGVHGPSLWVTDGTTGRHVMAANLFDFWSEEGPKGLTATTDRLFFQTESDLGREVHSLLHRQRGQNHRKRPPAKTPGSTETAYTYSTTGGSIPLDGSDILVPFRLGRWREQRGGSTWESRRQSTHGTMPAPTS